MKTNKGKLSEADLKTRRRLWNKKGFFGEPSRYRACNINL